MKGIPESQGQRFVKFLPITGFFNNILEQQSKVTAIKKFKSSILTIKNNEMTTTHINKVAASMTIVVSMIFFGACNKTNVAKEVQQYITVAKPLIESVATETWVDSWAASFLSTKVNGTVQSTPSFNNQTFRLNVFSKLGGTRVRVKLTNKFATNTLTIGAVHIALRSTNNSIIAYERQNTKV